jgi:hypothetical protein
LLLISFLPDANCGTKHKKMSNKSTNGIKRFKNITRHHLNDSFEPFEEEESLNNYISESPFQYDVNNTMFCDESSNCSIHRNIFNLGDTIKKDNLENNLETESQYFNQQLIKTVDDIELKQRIYDSKQQALAKRKRLATATPCITKRSSAAISPLTSHAKKNDSQGLADWKVKEHIENNKQEALAKRRRRQNSITTYMTATVDAPTPKAKLQFLHQSFPTTATTAANTSPSPAGDNEEQRKQQRIRNNRQKALLKRAQLACGVGNHARLGVTPPPLRSAEEQGQKTNTSCAPPLPPEYPSPSALLMSSSFKLTTTLTKKEQQAERIRLSRLAALRRKTQRSI